MYTPYKPEMMNQLFGPPQPGEFRGQNIIKKNQLFKQGQQQVPQQQEDQGQPEDQGPLLPFQQPQMGAGQMQMMRQSGKMPLSSVDAQAGGNNALRAMLEQKYRDAYRSPQVNPLLRQRAQQQYGF